LKEVRLKKLEQQNGIKRAAEKKEKIQDMTPKQELRTKKDETNCHMLTTRSDQKRQEENQKY
jgi:hypothetical protein